jgi:hypothetical protein
MLARLLFLFFFLSVIAPTRAQEPLLGLIKGHVIDSDGEFPIPGVTITIQSEDLMGERQAQTDSDGRFLFPELPPGLYTLSAARNNFETTRMEPRHVYAGRATVVAVTLERRDRQDGCTWPGLPARPVVDQEHGEHVTVLEEPLLQRAPAGRSGMGAARLTPGVTSR